MSFITISDIVECKGKICDIEYKDLAIPVGLIVENTNSSNNTNYEEIYDDKCINDNLYFNILKNEKRKRIKKYNSKKNKPLKLKLTLKRKI